MDKFERKKKKGKAFFSFFQKKKENFWDIKNLKDFLSFKFF
jgi:hypothetical protein